MNKYLLKIMELLDKEGLVDKSIKPMGKFLSDDGFIYTSIKTVLRDDNKRDVSHHWVFEDTRHPKFVLKRIGQIHLGHILQWFHKKGHLHLPLSNGRIASGRDFINLDLGKPPMERDEEQRKELYNFMIKCTQ